MLLEIHRCLQERPLTNIANLARRAGITFATASRTLGILQHMGMVSEVTGRKRNRIFSYERYVRILSEGTEPLRA